MIIRKYVVVWVIRRGSPHNERKMLINSKAIKFAEKHCFEDAVAVLDIVKPTNSVVLADKDSIFGHHYMFTKILIKVYENV